MFFKKKLRQKRIKRLNIYIKTSLPFARKKQHA